MTPEEYLNKNCSNIKELDDEITKNFIMQHMKEYARQLICKTLDDLPKELAKHLDEINKSINIKRKLTNSDLVAIGKLGYFIATEKFFIAEKALNKDSA